MEEQLAHEEDQLSQAQFVQAEEAFAPVEAPPPSPDLVLAVMTVIGLLLFQLCVAIVLGIVGAAVGGERLLKSGNFIDISIFLTTLATVVYGFWMAYLYYRRQMMREVGFRLPAILHLVLVLLATMPLAVLVSEMNNWLSYVIPQFGLMPTGPLKDMPIPILIWAACAFPALGEELLFRGIIGRGLVGRWGARDNSLGMYLAIVVTSIMFGVIHFEPLQAASAAVLGVGLHFIFLTTKSLWAPILLHFLNNFCALMAMRHADEFPLPGLTMADNNGLPIHTSTIVVSISLGLAAVLFILLWITRVRWVASDGTVAEPIFPGAVPPAGAWRAVWRPHSWLLAASLFLAAVVLEGCLIVMIYSSVPTIH